jgi:hypothetical protein
LIVPAALDIRLDEIPGASFAGELADFMKQRAASNDIHRLLIQLQRVREHRRKCRDRSQ